MTRAEERVKELIDRMCTDYDRLQEAFPDLRTGQYKATICQLDYVQKFALHGPQCHLEERLPKGIRKSDGRKVRYSAKYGGRNYSHTEYLVECGSNLYISGRVLKRGNPPKGLWVVLEDWKSLTAVEAISEIRGGSGAVCMEMQDAVMQLYRDNGIPLGYTVPILRDLAGERPP